MDTGGVINLFQKTGRHDKIRTGREGLEEKYGQWWKKESVSTGENQSAT